jgi:3-phosphoshikimate 1-carboxyvinyltransferase
MNPASLQGDRVMLDFLRKMGARVNVHGTDIAVSRHQLKGIRADLSDCIDLLPTVAVLAALTEGTTELSGIRQARLKESNRIAAVREGLTRLGIAVNEEENRLKINGGLSDVKTPVVLNSHDDHRIAMAFSVLGAAYGNIVIDGAECVAKTFPTYWDEFKNIGGEVKLNE